MFSEPILGLLPERICFFTFVNLDRSFKKSSAFGMSDQKNTGSADHRSARRRTAILARPP